MKITVLSENTSRAGLPAEHGLSLYIETGSDVILFDTGQSALFAENAQQLGIDLKNVRVAVISHGHFDHGGGLAKFLQINEKAPVYISRYAFEPHYGVEGKYIGLDLSLRENPRLVFTDGVTGIGEGLTLYSCNEREKIFSPAASGLSTEEDGVIREDDFRHEQYLLAEENGKKILFSGCSHKGIKNIMEWFHPDILIGGFHFFRLPLDEKLCACAQDLDAYNTEYYTCHCTGTEQYQYMLPLMKNLHYISAGQTIII